MLKVGPKTATFDIEHPSVPVVAGKFRTYLPQVLAATAKNLLLIDIGMAIAFPTIVIPALTGLQPAKYPDEPIRFSANEASWFGSIGFIGQTLGSSISGWATEPFGRKRSMIFVNVPHIIAWTIMYFAQSKEEMIFVVVLIGFGIGIMEAPILTYVSEITQPSIRGILLSCSMVAAMIGFQIVYVMGMITTWRNAALACLSVPVFAVVAITLIPETPSWLLSKNRHQDAIQSLQWLRGWVSKEAVDAEYQALVRCSEMGNACDACRKSEIKCSHPSPSLAQKWRALCEIGTRRPFFLMVVIFLVNTLSGLSAIRPFLVQIFQTFVIPTDGNMGTVIIAAVSIVANVLCMCLIRLTGRRKIYLFSLTGCAISCLTLGIYGKLKIPTGYSTFHEHAKEPFVDSAVNYIPICMFICLAFFTNLGVYPVAFTLLSEVFPFKTRSMAAGLVIALSYIFGFGSTKTFINLESFLSIGGTFIFYGAVSCFGVCYMYMFMPETENYTLEEVEMFFSNPDRSLFDNKIYHIPDVAAETHLMPHDSTTARASDL